jgi:hypothetical protein
MRGVSLRQPAMLRRGLARAPLMARAASAANSKTPDSSALMADLNTSLNASAAQIVPWFAENSGCLDSNRGSWGLALSVCAVALPRA